MEFREGDFVTLVPAFRAKKEIRYVFKLRRGEKFHSQHGTISHDDLIGREPGFLIETNTGAKFYALPSTLYEAIMRSNEFRYVTQIIYPRDWALILIFADIRPGRRVVEIGTGSGAFTAVLVWHVGETGWVYTYERDPSRAERALKNLKNLGVPERYTLKVRDVAKDGIDERDVDVVFADIPEPWTVVEHAWSALKRGGFFVAYVPTYNQVEKTLLALRERPFTDIRVIEGFLREIQPKPEAVRPMLKGYYFSAFIIFARKVASVL